MGKARNDFVDRMRDHFMARIDEWLGFDIPEEGTEDHDMWMSKIAEVEQIQSLQDVITYLEDSMGQDFAQFVIEGEYNLIEAEMNPLEIPRSVVLELGELVALEEEAEFEYELYEYGAKCFAVPRGSDTNIRCFDSEREAFAFLGIDIPSDARKPHDASDANHVKPLSVDFHALREDLERYKSAVSRVVKRRPTRIIHVLVPEWPDGTMAFQFGSALYSSLYTEKENVRMVQFEPERIFRVETAVTESEFRETLSKYQRLGVSGAEPILFVVGEMSLPAEGPSS